MHLRKIIFTLSLLLVAALMYGQTPPTNTLPPAPRTGSTMTGRPANHWQPGEHKNMEQGKGEQMREEHMLRREEALKHIEERLAKITEREMKLREALEKAHQERQELMERKQKIERAAAGSNVQFQGETPRQGNMRPTNGGTTPPPTSSVAPTK